MSTTIIRETISSNDVPTDVTSIVLSDPTGTFGLKRTDTDEVLIVNDAPFTHKSTGVYEISLTDPGPNIPYEYWVKLVYLGEITQYKRLTASLTNSPTCIYFTYEEFISRWGYKNILVASNKENSSNSVDTTAVQMAFDYAVSELHRLMRGGIWAIPLTWEDGLTDPTVKDWVMTIAYENLYNARGMREDKVGTHLTKQLEIVYMKIASAKSGQLSNINAITDTTVSVDQRVVDLMPDDFHVSNFWWLARKATL